MQNLLFHFSENNFNFSPKSYRERTFVGEILSVQEKTNFWCDDLKIIANFVVMV